MTYKPEGPGATQIVDNLGGKEIMDNEKVPPSLAEIAPILRVANQIESENPRVAYLCRFYAYGKALRLDPPSSGAVVHQFFIMSLLWRLKKEDVATSGGLRISDAREMENFFRYYFRKYIQPFQNSEEAYRTLNLIIPNRTAEVLFMVLKDVSRLECVKVPDEISKAHAYVVAKGGAYNPNTFVLQPESSDHAHENPEMKQPKDYHIPLEAIIDCTENFNDRNIIGKGGYGKVYKGILNWEGHENELVAVKRLNASGFQGKKEFLTEVTMLSQYHHEGIVTLIGFCDDNKEMILIYEYASRGSLDKYLGDTDTNTETETDTNTDNLERLSWPQLLQICIGVASALDYLHNHVADSYRIIHRDIKSANVLLDENWNPKLSDFGLARIGLANQQNTTVITNIAGTPGYDDPQYANTSLLSKESDVFSFGVVLFEVLCGRLAIVLSYHNESRFLHHLARTSYEDRELDKIIDHRIRNDIKPGTLTKFSDIAYQCLQKTREQRPLIADVLFQLTEAMEIQLED